MTTIDELKELRAELVQRRMAEVFRLGTYSDDRLAVVANIQTTLAAIDAVIEKGDVPPEYEPRVDYI